MTQNKSQKIVFISAFCLLSSFFFSQLLASEELASKKTKSNSKKENPAEEKKKVSIKINENDFDPVLIGKLLENPKDYLDKKIKFRGKFSSFTTLALDYEGALRKSKDYISICIFRPDSKIPLSELKLAFPLKEAKEDEVIKELEEGDLLEIYGKEFSTALDEPWVDIVQLKKIKSAAKKEEKLVEEQTENKQDKKTKNLDD